MFISNIVMAIINTNHLYIEDHNNYLRCFYMFGDEQIGAILIKQNGVIHGYKTSKVPDTFITKALIKYCKMRVS